MHIAAGRKYKDFLAGTGFPYTILPGIQERDDSGFPTFKWFRDPAYIRQCIRAEADLLRRLKPDRALGVFSFTLPLSSAMAEVPYDTLICGCMLKDCGDIMGFRGSEPDAGVQQMNLNTFFHYAGQKIKAASEKSTLCRIDDARELLRGTHTFLWDFPEFMPLPLLNDVIHVGPVLHYPSGPGALSCPHFFSGPEKTAVISFGTCSGRPDILHRLTRICIQSGFRVFIAAGGRSEYMSMFSCEPDVCVRLFPDLNTVLPRADLFICHGGQLSVFQAFKAGVPVLVMPFQPEQAHNGICLERVGCGRMIIPPIPFRTDQEVYVNTLESITDENISEMITTVCSDTDIHKNLSRIGLALERYSGAERVAATLEGA